MLVEILGSYDQELVSAALSLIVFMATAIWQARVRLCWGGLHGFTYLVPIKNTEGEPQRKLVIHTASYVFMNRGRKTAHNVDITLNFEPHSYQVWPPRQHDHILGAENRLILRFDYLPPKDQFSINILTEGNPNPEVLNVMSEEEAGKQIELKSVQSFPRYIHIILLILIAVGTFSTVYLTVLFVGFLSNLG